MLRREIKGFSLIELTMVVGLIGILSVVITWSTKGTCENCNVQLQAQGIAKLNRAVETYIVRFIQETDDDVPKWDSKEAVARALKAPLPKSNYVVWQDVFSRIIPRIKWDQDKQIFVQ